MHKWSKGCIIITVLLQEPCQKIEHPMVLRQSYSVEIHIICQNNEVHSEVLGSWDSLRVPRVENVPHLMAILTFFRLWGRIFKRLMIYELLYERFTSMWKGLHNMICQSYISFYGLGLHEDGRMESIIKWAPSTNMVIGWEDNDHSKKVHEKF